MNRNKLLVPALLLAASFFLFGRPGVAAAEELKEKTILNGVYIDTVHIGGMTREEARAAVEDHIEALQSKGIAIIAGDHTVYKTMDDISYTYKPHEDYVKQAFDLVTTGNLIKRYKDIKDIEHGKIIYPLEFTYDEGKLRDIVEREVTLYDISPVNATFTRKNGEFIYTDHEVGSKVDVEQTVEAIKSLINDWNRMDIIAQAVMVDDMPAFTREEIEKSNSLLGEYTTEFKDSSEDRAANVENGARLINNTVLYPGDVFNAMKLLVPFTEANGYKVGHSYLNGEIVDSVGGGACQVTTTLYNAVLLSELEIVERNAHSMTVSYVPLSFDAAIAEGSKNFQFKNNMDMPILIEAIAKNRTITFRIWGYESRDTQNRKIEYVNKVTSEIQPSSKDKITKDPTQPTTYKKITQKARLGYTAELYKIVYENGKEVERVLVNKSSYMAEPNHVTIGTKKAKSSDKTKNTTKTKTTGN